MCLFFPLICGFVGDYGWMLDVRDYMAKTSIYVNN